MVVKELNVSTYVLVVDDEHIFRRLISVILGPKLRVETAGDGFEALEMITQEKPDLIILDVMMPLISGLDIAWRLAKDEQLQAIPLIILTALDSSIDASLQQQIEELGAFHLTKPFSRQQLLDTVQTALAKLN